MSAFVSELPRRLGYLIVSLALIASQNFLVWWTMRWFKTTPAFDVEFWLTPLRSALEISTLPPLGGALFFAYFLAVAYLLAMLSFNLARRTKRGFTLAVLSVVPVIQLGAILINAVLPAKKEAPNDRRIENHLAKSIVVGLIAGTSIIVFAVLISAVTFGAYGWGLFVMTPFLVGAVTGYLLNSESELSLSTTLNLSILAAGLGSLALIVMALEGLFCIILAAPLALPFVLIGAGLGRTIAKARHKRRTPLMSVAVLPIIFMLEGAVPPVASIHTRYEIEISAPAENVWAALVSDEPIKISPGLPAVAGLAYPIRSKLDGEGVGAKRVGSFSTGQATEVVSQWVPNRRLAFKVQHQPPAMEEMSPYRRVHAPHVEGYFLTGETQFDLVSVSKDRTRLEVTSEHVLRIDPIPYWEPIARLAIGSNVYRVLKDIKAKSET
jgi:hypothetical protein